MTTSHSSGAAPRAVRDYAMVSRSLQEAESKLLVAEKTIAAQRKEILVLQRQATADSPAGGTAKGRATTRCEGGTPLAQASAAVAAAPSADVAALQAKVRELQDENRALLNCVRKQNKLIDVLKRQKILLEAATLLDLSEREFDKYLELEKSC